MKAMWRDLWISQIQEKDIAGQPAGPMYKGGLTPEIIAQHPELNWMIEADQHVVTGGSEPGELVWVLSDVWDAWAADHPE